MTTNPAGGVTPAGHFHPDTMTTQADIRAAFWQAFPQFRRRFVPAGRSPKSGRMLYRPARQNDYPATIRAAFVDYVDHLSKSGTIPAALAQSVTL